MTGALFFFSALGSFNGLILSFYLFFISKTEKLSKYLLGALTLSLSLRIGKSVLLYFDPELPKSYLQFGLTACLFIGPFLYFYVKSVRDKIEVFPKEWMAILITLAVLAFTVGSIFPYYKYPDYWNNFIVQSIYGIWFLFILATGYTLRDNIERLWHRTSLPPEDKWLTIIFFFNVAISLVFISAMLGAGRIYYISGPLVFTFFIYVLIYGYFYRDQSEFSGHKSSKRYANKKIDDAEANEQLSHMIHIMQSNQPFLDSNFKLKDLSALASLPSHRVSQILNDNMGKNFSTFINEYRIQEACALLGENDHLSLEGIGYKVGFKSKSTFFTTFKKVTGVTPSVYQDQKSKNIKI